MLTIYSICRAIASHQIELPSVFAGEGGLKLFCGGCSLEAGRDYLIHGSVVEMSGGPLLAVTSACPADSLPHFAHVFGEAGEGGRVGGGFLVEKRGLFSGALFAVDKNRLVVGENSAGRSVVAPSPAPVSVALNQTVATPLHGSDAPSGDGRVPATIAGSPQVSRGVVSHGPAVGMGAGGGSDQRTAPRKPEIAAGPAASKAVPKAVPKPATGTAHCANPPTEDDIFEERKPAWEASIAKKAAVGAPGGSDADGGVGAGEGVPVEGTAMVVRSLPSDDFPVSGVLPELAGVKRSELARKAEARKKGARNAAPAPAVTPAVSSSGIRLGKESGGDNAGGVVQNKIDESELW